MADRHSVRAMDRTAGGGASLRPIAREAWKAVAAGLDQSGFAVMPGLVSPADCSDLAALYDTDDVFRTRIVMARHGFGSGEYKYFTDPLPEAITDLRRGLYAGLAPIANGWMSRLGRPPSFPETHDAFRDLCHVAGQMRPTPLLLRYEAGDYNCLHQDLYGATVFPLQVAVLLSEPGRDFDGGEFVLVEQRPRMQSRAHVVPLRQGDAVVFAVNERPVAGSRGDYRVRMRHGVSTIRAGRRHTLGIIFHDSK